MGCDCDGKLIGWVKPEEVVKALFHLGYKNIISHVGAPAKNWLRSEFQNNYPNELSKLNPSYPASEYHETISGFINFDAFGEQRNLFYYYANECFATDLEELPENEGKDLSEIEFQELTSLSLGSWGHSREIMRSILKVLGGGYVDDNDCDDIPPYFIVPEMDIRKRVS